MSKENALLFDNFIKSIGMSNPRAAFLAAWAGKVMENSEEYAGFLERFEARLLAEAEAE